MRKCSNFEGKELFIDIGQKLRYSKPTSLLRVSFVLCAKLIDQSTSIDSCQITNIVFHGNIVYRVTRAGTILIDIFIHASTQRYCNDLIYLLS